MKYLFITWILMVSSIILAQINDPIDDESKSFVKIMLTSKQYKQNIESLLIKTIEESGINIERYGEIIRSRYDGLKIVLTEKDSATLLKIKVIQKAFNTRKEETLNALCVKEKLNRERFDFLLDKYRKDITYQQALLPIISSEIANK
ncbi:MAG: hypothetical protein IPN86_00885 [Saprospiraceae bacterium]|nr:hypothetical protein [Saprospiraceae bacterium]